MHLNKFTNTGFDRGKPAWYEGLWLIAHALFVNSWQPNNTLRVFVLKLFGANIGTQVVIKPNVKVKFPWKLTIGDFSWIGENAWIDNLDDVRIGKNCCISQGVYLCTGSHDWNSPTFDLKMGRILVGDQVWLCAQSVIGPGTTVGTGAILTLGSVASGHLSEWSIYSGNLAKRLKKRQPG